MKNIFLLNKTVGLSMLQQQRNTRFNVGGFHKTYLFTLLVCFS